MDGAIIRRADGADVAAIVALYEQVVAESVAWGLNAPGEREARAQLGPLAFVRGVQLCREA